MGVKNGAAAGKKKQENLFVSDNVREAVPESWSHNLKNKTRHGKGKS